MAHVNVRPTPAGICKSKINVTQTDINRIVRAIVRRKDESRSTVKHEELLAFLQEKLTRLKKELAELETSND